MTLYRMCITGLVVLLIAMTPFNVNVGRSKGPSRDTPAGPQAYGFALALTADQSTAAVGQPAWVTLEIRNVTGTLQHASAFARADSHAFDFSVVNTSTHEPTAINPNRSSGADSIGGPIAGGPVPANTSIFLQFEINDLYQMTKPGTYVVRLNTVRLRINGQIVSMPPSNSVSFTLR